MRVVSSMPIPSRLSLDSAAFKQHPAHISCSSVEPACRARDASASLDSLRLRTSLVQAVCVRSYKLPRFSCRSHSVVCTILIPTARCAHCRWMEQHEGLLRDHSLLNITLPGTHDSASFALTDRVMPGSLPWPLGALVALLMDLWWGAARWIIGWSQAQTLGIGEQLRQGARYLDMRTGATSWRFAVSQ
jgi:hypothetical protein